MEIERRHADPSNHSKTDSFLPFSGFHHLADLALDQVSFERADVADVKLAIQMIGLMQKCSCQQVLAGFLEKLVRSNPGLES